MMIKFAALTAASLLASLSGVSSRSSLECPSKFGFPSTFMSCGPFGKETVCCDGKYAAALESMCENPQAMPPGVCRAFSLNAFDSYSVKGPLAKTFPLSPEKNETGTPLTFKLHATNKNGDGWTKSTFRSQAMPLSPGEVVFTSPGKTGVQMHGAADGATVSIRRMVAEVVDADGTSIPLDEVYNHHWLFFDPTSANSGVCGGFLSYKFGVGAESRNTPTSFPSPYVVETRSKVWGANIHLLRTVDLDPAQGGVKGCIECAYAEGKGCKESESGSFNCCQNGSRCPTLSNHDASKEYFLQYSVEWRVASSDDVPVDIYVLDASNCQIEYNIDENNITGVHTTDLTWPAQKDSKFVFGVGHQHIGGINTTLMYKSPSTGENDAQEWKTLCTSYPTYGETKGKAGDEAGYVTKISGCAGLSQSVKKGSQIRVLSLYDVSPNFGKSFDKGGHGGVMSLFYVAAVAA